MSTQNHANLYPPRSGPPQRASSLQHSRGARDKLHTVTVSTSLPSFGSGADAQEVTDRLGALLETAHRVWTSPLERRRMRAFGFRPAVEQGVLKRDWRSLRVRVAADGLRVASPGVAELAYVPSEGGLLLDGGPFRPTPAALTIVDELLGLISAYERWVEAREGRKERISRAPTVGDRRPVNSLAETRRLQRMLQTGGRAARSR